MEMQIINTAVSAGEQLNQKQKTNSSQGDMPTFAVLFQGFLFPDSGQNLVDSNSLNLADNETIKKLYSKIVEILESGKQPQLDLMVWYQELSPEEQQTLHQFLDNILYSEQHLKLKSGQFENLNLKPIEEHQAQLKNFLLEIKEILLKNTADIKEKLINNENNISQEKIMLKDEQAKTAIKFPDNSGKTHQNNNQADIKEKLINNENNISQEKIVLKDEQAKTAIKFPDNSGKTHQHNNQTDNKNSYETKMDVRTLDLSRFQFQHSGIQTIQPETGEVADLKQKMPVLNTNEGNFTAELGKVIIRNLKLPNGLSETTIQLHPKELGQIGVKLITNNGQISAQIIAETILGKELLEAQIHQLKQSLTHQGYQVERIEVQQVSSASSTLAQNFKNSFNFSGQQFANQEQHQQKPQQFQLSYSEDVEEFTQQLLTASGIDYLV